MKTRRYAKVRKAKSYAKTRNAMKNTKTRKALSYTKAMKHIKKKTTNQKNITESISTTVVATMSPVTITIVHYA
jgi:DNA topoisomerase IB